MNIFKEGYANVAPMNLKEQFENVHVILFDNGMILLDEGKKYISMHIKNCIIYWK